MFLVFDLGKKKRKEGEREERDRKRDRDTKTETETQRHTPAIELYPALLPVLGV